MVLDILKVQNPADASFLKKKATDVTSFGEHMKAITDNMIETMLVLNDNGHPRGVGLAGPQVGIGLNFFVMIKPEALEKGTYESMVIINPHVIIEYNNLDNVEMEGCLSIPGLLGKVQRYKEIGVVFQDVYGKRHGLALSGFAARVFQHEYDHLEGVLFTDRTKDLYRPKKKST